MKPTALKNLRVLITRPQHQQENFKNLLLELGAIPISLPLIEISPTEEIDEARTQLKILKTYDYVVFVSPNAVNFSHKLQAFPWENSTCKIVAIGDVTSKTLLNYGVKPDLAPMEKFSSETVLKTPQFHSVENLQIGVVSGNAGRTLLQEELHARGARVKTVVVYKSAAPSYLKKSIYGVFNDSTPQIICITSNQGILNLVSVVDQELREQLLLTPLIVNSIRCRDLSRELGFISDITVANNPGDAGQLEGLRQWYSNHIFNNSE